MGSRGAKSGIAMNGKKYGTEYTTLMQSGRVKYVKYNDSSAVKAPMETMTRGRIYATIDNNNDVHYISFYDDKGKRKKQIDIKGKPHIINGEKVLPHKHLGYEHDENGTDYLSKYESKQVAKILYEWYNYKQGK